MGNWANKFGTDTFEGFMKKLCKDFDGNLKFFNRKATMETNSKVAELVLSTKGTSGQYERINVAIVHKDNGPLASESFNFCDYLMNGYKAEQSTPHPRVIDHCGIDWYMNGPTPQAIKHLMERIREYISLYM